MADWWIEVVGEIRTTYEATHRHTPKHPNANWGEYCLAMVGVDFRPLCFTTASKTQNTMCQNPALKPFLACLNYLWSGGIFTAQEILDRRNAAIAELVARTVDGKTTFIQTLNYVPVKEVHPLPKKANSDTLVVRINCHALATFSDTLVVRIN